MLPECVATSSGSTAAGTGALNTTVNYALTFGRFHRSEEYVPDRLQRKRRADQRLGPSRNMDGERHGWRWRDSGSVVAESDYRLRIPRLIYRYFTHTGGATQHYLGYMLFLPTPNVVNYTATGSCLVEYNRISNGMRLIDNAGTGWLGGIEGIPLGTPGAVLTTTIYVRECAERDGVCCRHTMSVNVPVTFQATLGPVLGTFLQALDVNGVWTGMTQFGNWVLPGAPQTRIGPAISGISPTNTAGSNVNYTITATHPSGAGALSQVHLMISDRIVGGSPCQVVYFPGNNTLNLINDAGNALVSPTGRNTWRSGDSVKQPLRSKRCGCSRHWHANSVPVTMPMIFSPATFGGLRNVYGIAFDNTGLTSHWVRGATLIVQ